MTAPAAKIDAGRDAALLSREVDTGAAREFLSAIFLDQGLTKIRLRALPQDRDAAQAAVAVAKAEAHANGDLKWYEYLPQEHQTSNYLLEKRHFQRDWRGRMPFEDVFRNDDRALYYQINACESDIYTEKADGVRVMRKQARDGDITHIVGCFADYDTNKELIVGAVDAADRARRMRREKDRLKDLALTLRDHPAGPSVLVHSGNGFQALWLLEKPVEATEENRNLFRQAMANLHATWSGADVGVHDLPRILRLPGSWNAKPGREAKQAAVIWPQNIYAARRYDLAELATSPDLKTGTPPAERTDASPAVEKIRQDRRARGLHGAIRADPETLAVEYGLDIEDLRQRLNNASGRVGGLWRDGVNDAAFHAKHGSRRGSEFRFWLASAMRRAGWTFAEFSIACLLHEDSHGVNPVDGRQLERAWASCVIGDGESAGGGTDFVAIAEDDEPPASVETADNVPTEREPVPALTLAEAQTMTAAVAGQWFGQVCRRSRAWRHPEGQSTVFASPASTLLRVAPGVGKSSAVLAEIRRIAAKARAEGFMVRIAIVVPDHGLAQQWLRGLTDEAGPGEPVRASIYEGLDRTCRVADKARAWIAAKGDLTTFCKQCPFREKTTNSERCRYRAQDHSRSEVLVLAGQAVFERIPDAARTISGPGERREDPRFAGIDEDDPNCGRHIDSFDLRTEFDCVVLDECEPGRWIGEVSVSTDALNASLAGLPWSDVARDAAHIVALRAVAALADQIVGRVRRAIDATMAEHRLVKKHVPGVRWGENGAPLDVDLRTLGNSDWMRLASHLRRLITKPGTADAVEWHQKKATERFKFARRLQTIAGPLLAMAEAMALDEFSVHRGYLQIHVKDADDGADSLDGLTVYKATAVHPDWEWCPKLLLDGTAIPEVIERFFGHLDVFDIGCGDGAGVRRRHFDAGASSAALRDGGLDRALALVAQAEGRVGLILPKDHEAKVTARFVGSGEAVATLHYGRLRGQNSMQDVDHLFLVGRHLPPSYVLRRNARVIFGWPVEESAHYRNLPRLATTSIPMRRNGAMTMVQAATWRHDCREIDLMLKSALDAEMVQADARARGVRRTDANPVTIDHLTGQPVPGLVYDAVNAALPGAETMTDRVLTLAAQGFAASRYQLWALRLGVKPRQFAKWCARNVRGGKSGGDMLGGFWFAALKMDVPIYGGLYRGGAAGVTDTAGMVGAWGAISADEAAALPQQWN